MQVILLMILVLMLPLGGVGWFYYKKDGRPFKDARCRYPVDGFRNFIGSWSTYRRGGGSCGRRESDRRGHAGSGSGSGLPDARNEAGADVALEIVAGMGTIGSVRPPLRR